MSKGLIYRGMVIVVNKSRVVKPPLDLLYHPILEEKSA